MIQALKNVDIGVKVSGQLTSNLSFADDIDLIAESQEGLQHLTDKVNGSSKRLETESQDKYQEDKSDSNQQEPRGYGHHSE